MFLIVFSVGLMTFGLGSLGGGRVIAGKSESTFSHLTNNVLSTIFCPGPWDSSTEQRYSLFSWGMGVRSTRERS